jgi:hypothetical protein
MGKFHRGRSKWQERNVAHDKRHVWSVVSDNGIVVGTVELQRNGFVAYDISGAAIGKFNSLSDARQALLMQRR